MVLQSFQEWFWNPDMWLPPNVTWADIVPNDKIQYTNSRDLWYPLPLALVLLFVRLYLERKVYSPFGIWLGIKPPRKPNIRDEPTLAEIGQSGRKLNDKELHELTIKLKMTERQIQRWLRIHMKHRRTSKLSKFCENSFRCTYYCYSFLYGLWALWDKEWLWDINACWYSYPHQSIDREIWWYYVGSLAFYWSLMVSQFFDVKHKDFWQMFVHHVATIFLMSFSWICNMTRIGCLVLLIHDCADIFLDGSKMMMYAKKQRICDTLFAIFTISWVVTRLGFFPFWIIHSTAIGAPKIVPMFPAYYFFNGLLMLLLVLHLFWTYLIFKVVYNSVMSGKMERDIRSSSDDETDDSAQENGVTKKKD